MIDRIIERIEKMLPGILMWGVPVFLLCFLFGVGFWWALLIVFVFWSTVGFVLAYIVESYKARHRYD